MTWLKGQGQRPLYGASFGQMDIEPHVLATLAIYGRPVSSKCSRFVRMLYAVTHKDYTYNEHNSAYDCVMVASEFGQKRLAPLDIRAEVVGCPKLDDFFNGVMTKESARKQLGVDPQATMVLYAPTFADGCTVEQFGAAVMALPDHVELLLQLHPVSYLNEMDRFSELGTRCRLVAAENASIASLVAADVILTDYSGVIFEACAMDTPVILLDKPGLPENDDPELACRDAGPRLEQPDDLRAAVERALEDPQEHSERRQEYGHRFFEHRGKAGRRAADVLQSLEREAREARWRDMDLIYNRMRMLQARLPSGVGGASR